MSKPVATLATKAAPLVQDLVVQFKGKKYTGKAVLGKSWLQANNPIVLVFP